MQEVCVFTVNHVEVYLEKPSVVCFTMLCSNCIHKYSSKYSYWCPFVLFFLQLDESKDFEERKMIRAAMRDLRKKKRGNGINKQSSVSG